VCGKSEGKHFKTKCSHAGTLLIYLAMKYLKRKVQLKFRYNSINSPIFKILNSLTPNKY